MMEWMAIAVLVWTSSPTAAPPTIQVAVESEALCKEAVEALARDLGAIALAKAAGRSDNRRNLVLTSCVRIAD